MDGSLNKTSQNGLFYLVRMVLLLIPYLIAGIFLNEIALASRFEVIGLTILGGILCFLLDILLQTFLKQDFSGKVFYLFFISGVLYAGYIIVNVSYVLLLAQRTENLWIISSIAQIFFLLYWIYLNIKKFSLEIWDLDLV